MEQLAKALDSISFATAWVIQWLALFMVVATIIVVVLRYGLNVGAIPLQESITYMHGLLFLFGIPFGLRQGTHVRVDLVYSRLSPKAQQTIDLAGHVLFLFPVAIFILVSSIPYAAASWRILEGSPEVGGLPAVFLLKTFIPVAACLLIIQAVAETLKTLRRLTA